MGISKRKIVSDESGITFFTLSMLFFSGGFATAFITYWYETQYASESLISPETSPTLAGLGIEYLWIIIALIVAITFFFWIVIGKASPRKT